MFDTDLDDMMACYQTGCSSFGLPTPKNFWEWLEQVLFKHNYFHYLWPGRPYFFFLLLRNIDRCDLFRNDVPNIDWY